MTTPNHYLFTLHVPATGAFRKPSKRYLVVDNKNNVFHVADHHKASVYPEDSPEFKTLEALRKADSFPEGWKLTRRASQRKGEYSLGKVSHDLNSAYGALGMILAQIDRLQSLSAEHGIVSNSDVAYLTRTVYEIKAQIHKRQLEYGIKTGRQV